MRTFGGGHSKPCEARGLFEGLNPIQWRTPNRLKGIGLDFVRMIFILLEPSICHIYNRVGMSQREHVYTFLLTSSPEQIQNNLNVSEMVK